jgi:pyruvate dehydrogenase E2 component (dihydrolipoamide acetyltransferase)
VLADVERATPQKAPASAQAEAGARPERVAGKSVKIRRIVARKMLESWQNIPHFFVTVALFRSKHFFKLFLLY